MRSDLRQPEQLRPINFQPDFLPTAEGSVLVSAGHTRVLCTASIEETVPPFLRNQGKGWVTAEYSMLPRATLTRTAREAAKGKQSGRTVEIQRLIGRALRAVVDTTALGERTLLLDCDVLQADGGTRTTSICGAFVAMAMALQRLVAAGTLPRLPLRDYLAATSVGIVGGVPSLDLNYEEDSRADVDMNIVMTGNGRYVELQATAEHEPFSDEQWQELLRLGRLGVAQWIERQRALLNLKLT